MATNLPDPDVPDAQPTEKDEKLALEFMRIKDETNLKGRPEGEQRCDNCHYYANPEQGISYCWHPKLEIMVGKQWWCDRWEEIGEPEEEMGDDDRQTNMKLRFTLVEDNQWVPEPKFGEQCNTCRYYLNPDESVSYCWHSKLQVAVGEDHWCTWYEEIPEA